MGNVPEIKTFAQQAEVTPAVEQPTPSLGAYGGAQAGAALEQTGERLFNVGWAAHQRAATAFAQNKETEFQQQAQKLSDQYKTLFNFDAVKARDKVSQDLEEARNKIAGTIESKLALGQYKNNSLRTMRLAQEKIDGHYETQNKSFQEVSYRDAQAVSSRSLASLAEGPGWNPASAAEKVKEIYDRAHDYADAHGLHDKNADLHAQKEVGPALDAYFDVLTDKHSGRSTQEVKDEFAKWNAKDFLSKHVQQKVMASGYAQEARLAVRNIFETTPRLSNDPKFDENPDPDGPPDIAGMQAKLNDYVKEHPEHEEIALHEWSALKSQVENGFTQEVHRRVNRVMAATREDMKRPGPMNGVFHADPTGRDYLWLMRNQSTALEPIIRSEYTTEHRLLAAQHIANATAFKADLITMAAREPEKFEKLTEADLFKMQDDQKYANGFSPKFRLEEAGKVLHGLKEQHAKNELGWINKTVVDYLKHNIYTGKDEAEQAHSGVVYKEIATALQEHLKAGTVKRDDWKGVNDFLAAETAKVDQTSLWGGKFGGQYKAERDAKLRGAQPEVAPAKPVVVPAKAADNKPHKIINVKRNGVDLKWDDTIKDWVK